MDIHSLIQQYGYAGLLIGSLAEGETITLLGGAAAHQGLLKFPLVIAAVTLGGIIGDQAFFFIGRCFGPLIFSRLKRHQTKVNRAQALIRRHPYLFVIGCRFMYGFRIIGPLIIGASQLRPRIFIPLNILGAAIWGTLFTSLGYLGGELLTPWLQQFTHPGRLLLWLIPVALVLSVVFIWRRKIEKHNDG